MSRQNLGRLINARRLSLDLTMVKVCELTGGQVLPCYISQLESGRFTGKLNVDRVLKVTRALQLDDNLIRLTLGQINENDLLSAYQKLEEILLEIRQTVKGESYAVSNYAKSERMYH